jgi:hypothetical protein
LSRCGPGDDLPAYAGALVDYYAARPEVVRLAAWHQLEPGGRPLPEAVLKTQREKIAAIEGAQAAGRVTKTYPADDLLTMILSLSHMTTDAGPVRPEHGGSALATEHKRMIVAAVAAVLAS